MAMSDHATGFDPGLGRVFKGRRHTEAVANARAHLVEGEVRVEPVTGARVGTRKPLAGAEP